MKSVKITEGSSPIILSQPHGGTFVPENLMAHFNERGLAKADTDWHIGQVYQDLLADASVVQATFSRYVIDANRNPQGDSLYPGQNTTELCPTIDFHGEEIYQKGKAPDSLEINRRRQEFHQTYHQELSTQIERVKKINGIVLLFDCHSIASELPFLFDGRLPDLNIGTNCGKSCDPILEKAAFEICNASPKFSTVLNGRFKGGWTTRYYGNPSAGIHAIQLELAQRIYMEEKPPWSYSEEKSIPLILLLKQLLTHLEKQILITSN